MIRLPHTSVVLIIVISILIGLTGCSTSPQSSAPTSPTPAPSNTATPARNPAKAQPLPRPQPTPSTDPFALISQEHMLAFLQDLTDIQPHSGWRNSATEGEAQGLDYVQKTLGEFKYLSGLGLELERQTFHVFLAVESWENRLELDLGGRDLQVPADNIRGHRDDIAVAIRFDSDGTLNDAERNPVKAEGAPALIRSKDDIDRLEPRELESKIAFVDFELVSDMLMDKTQVGQRLDTLLAARPAGVVLVTEFSNDQEKSHGVFVADGSAFNEVKDPYTPPILYTRLEDLNAAGINGWDSLSSVEAASLTWDADVFSPGTSGNLAARIPGQDSSRAIILGAHIDSPNNPGAMDDGSGSVTLLEVARVLDAARVQPAVDVYLVWFGSEELGLYGSYHFAATHQELLDRTLAMLQVDMLSYPLDGIQATINLVGFPYTWLGDERITWPDYLSRSARRLNIQTTPIGYLGLESDNSAFVGFGVPNANMVYQNKPDMERLGSIHYACHIHDPYDTVELARKVSGVLAQMARLGLLAVLETGQDAPHLRVSPLPERRAVFVASHTEAHHMAPTAFVAIGMTLEMNGFDVDMIPYGQAVTSADLDDADLVVALPVVDYPSAYGDPDLYDEAWSQEEIEALETYVAQGGLLVLTNSARRLKYGNMVLDPNEDWSDANALAERFGVSYQSGALPDGALWLERVSPLMKSVQQLDLAPGNGVPFTIQTENWKIILAKLDQEPVVALVNYADGQILVLADVGILGAEWERPANLAFWKNLAWHARTR